MSAADRRQTPRLHVGDRVRIEMAPHGLTLSVLDFSLGGFRAECAAPFGPETYDFRVSTTDGAKTDVLRAKAVYCHRLGDPGDTPSYVSGFAFLDLRNPKIEARIRKIVDHLTAVLQVA
jgi:hypothetical protein